MIQYRGRGLTVDDATFNAMGQPADFSLLTDPGTYDTATSRSLLGDIIGAVGTSIGNVLFPGGTTPVVGPLPPGWLVPRTPTTPAAPQLPQIAGQIARSAPALSSWVKMAWRLLVTGTAVSSVVQFLTEQVPTDQNTAVAIVERAVRTKGGGRRMNPLNARALKRAIVRINRFDKFADRTEKVLRRYARRK